MTDRFEHDAPPTCMRRFDIPMYLLGALADAESRSVRAHIDGCPVCTVELRELRPVSDLISAAGVEALGADQRSESGPEPDLVQRIIDRAAAELERGEPAIDLTVDGPLVTAGRTTPNHRRWLGIAAALALFVMGAGSVLGAQRVLSNDPQTIAGQSVRFATVSLRNGATDNPDDPVRPRAWAWVGETPAGTYATLYTQHLEPGQVYKWWFERSDGSRVGLGSFKYPGSQQTWLVCPGSTSEPRRTFVAIGATDATGHEVLRTKLPPPDVRRV